MPAVLLLVHYFKGESYKGIINCTRLRRHRHRHKPCYLWHVYATALPRYHAKDDERGLINKDTVGYR